MMTYPENLRRQFIAAYYYILLFLFILSGLLVSVMANAQCYAVTKDATAVIDDGSYGVLDFNNPNFATPSDTKRASAAALITLFSGKTHYLKATGFNFSIPSTASICGVEIEVEKRAGGLTLGAWVSDDQVRLMKSGTITGNNLATSTHWPGSESYYTYGSNSNVLTTWGTSLTPADVNAGNFGVAFAAEFDGLAIALPSMQVNNIRVTVYVNPVLPTKIISFDAILKNNYTYLEWETTEEESNESVVLQRILHGETDWTDVVKFDMHTGVGDKKYSYVDPLQEKGSYSYRLAVNTITQTTYSKIKNIRFEGRSGISVYPNPSYDYIIIEGVGTGATQSLPVTNSFGQTVHLRARPMAYNKLEVNIQQLPGGMYYATIGGEKTRFLKR